MSYRAYLPDGREVASPRGPYRTFEAALQAIFYRSRTCQKFEDWRIGWRKLGAEIRKVEESNHAD